MHKTVAVGFHAVLIAVTLTNFMPFLSVAHGDRRLLFGLFLVGGALVALHLAVGVVGLCLALFNRRPRVLLGAVGALFAVLAVAGFIGGTTAFGVFDVNLADNLLHSFFALSLFGASQRNPHADCLH